jgi:hypothetical protein
MKLRLSSLVIKQEGKAIALKNEFGSSHCLLAQVLESQRRQQSSLVQWRKCLEFGLPDHPDDGQLL